MGHHDRTWSVGSYNIYQLYGAVARSERTCCLWRQIGKREFRVVRRQKIARIECKIHPTSDSSHDDTNFHFPMMWNVYSNNDLSLTGKWNRQDKEKAKRKRSDCLSMNRTNPKPHLTALIWDLFPALLSSIIYVKPTPLWRHFAIFIITLTICSQYVNC